jgi:hypothetical protein
MGESIDIVTHGIGGQGEDALLGRLKIGGGFGRGVKA